MVLASASPRRRELIERLHVPCVCMESDYEESAAGYSDIPGAQLPLCFAEGKAAAVQRRLQAQRGERQEKQEGASPREPIIIGADTVVLLEGKVLGKPSDEAEAAAMLRSLSGRWHEVVTGVALLQGQKKICFSVNTQVCFYELSEAEIEGYIRTGEPMDKAGAYGIQGEAALFVREIRGDFYNVIGLPIAELAQRLKGFGVTVDRR